MPRTATLLALASIPALLACSTDPVGLAEQPPEDVPAVPATAALAFVSTREGAEHIYVANADGSGVTRLTEGSSPAWSWDARKIAFVRHAGGAGAPGIYVLDLDRLEETYAGEGDDPAWWPDGRLLFLRGSGIYTMNTDGSGATERLNAADLWDDFGLADSNSNGWPVANYNYGWSQPTASPDGRNVAFLWWKVFDSTRCVGIVDAGGFDPRDLEALCHPALTSGPIWSPPVWAPDGSAIAVFTGPGKDCSPDWSSNWWTCGASSESSVIYGYDVTSADRAAIYTTPPGFHAGNPDWSPDGSHLVFDAYKSMGQPLVRRIFIRSMETGEVRQLIPEAASPAVGGYDDYRPAWSRVIR